MNSDNRPIGVFDSGVGGISVLSELTALMPNENFIYYGDSVNAPYGVRDFDNVRSLTFATAEKLIAQNCKCLVIACNTATTAAVRPLRSMYGSSVPVIGIEPALKPAVLAKPGGRVLVLATAVTLREEKFHHLMDKYKDQAVILTMACPGIVEYVEQGITKGPAFEAYLTDLLSEYIDNPPDCVVLGCTHYPFVKDSINRVLKGKSLIFDGGAGTARETRHQLILHDICSDSNQVGNIIIENSNPHMIPLCYRLLEKARSGC